MGRPLAHGSDILLHDHLGRRGWRCRQLDNFTASCRASLVKDAHDDSGERVGVSASGALILTGNSGKGPRNRHLEADWRRVRRGGGRPGSTHHQDSGESGLRYVELSLRRFVHTDTTVFPANTAQLKGMLAPKQM